MRSCRSRPPPYNPGFSSDQAQSPLAYPTKSPARFPLTPHAPSYEDEDRDTFGGSYAGSYVSHHQPQPPPPPRRLYSSLPRRERRPVLTSNNQLPTYEETISPDRNSLPHHSIGFEDVTSVSRRRAHARVQLPMSPEAQQNFYRPSTSNLAVERSTVPPYSNHNCVSPAEISNTSGNSLCQNCCSHLAASPLDRNVIEPRLQPVGTFPQRPRSNSAVQIQYARLCSPSDVNANPQQSRQSVINFPSGKLDRCLQFEGYIDRNYESMQNVTSVYALQDLLLLIDSQSMFVRIYKLQDANRNVCDQHGTRRPAIGNEAIFSLLFSFKVVGVRSGCLWTVEKLLLVTHRGIRVTSLDGKLIHEINFPGVISVKPCQRSFAVAQSQSLKIFAGIDYSQTTAMSRFYSQKVFRKKYYKLLEISDFEFTSRNRLVVVDAGAGVIYIINIDGKIETKIKPSLLRCGAISRSVTSVCVDKYDTIFVADNGNRRVLQFLANGSYMATLIQFLSPKIASVRSLNALNVNDSDILPTVQAVTVTADGKLVVIAGCEKYSEVRIYRFL